MSEILIGQPATPHVTLSRLLLAPLRAMRQSSRAAAYADFTARPWGAVTVALLYSTWLDIASFEVQRLFATGNLPAWNQAMSVRGTAVAWLFALGVNALLLSAYGITVRFALRRVLRENIPTESAPMGVPPGVWLSLAWAAPVILLASLVSAALLAQPWLPALAAIGKAGLNVMAVIEYVVPLYMVRALYGIQHRSAAGRKLSLIMLTPVILLALVGIVLAIAFGLYKIHHPAAAVASASVQATNCNGRGPMLMPFGSREFGATVLGPVSQSEAMAIIQNGQRRVNGLLDPEYLNSPRVAIHQASAPQGLNVMAVVPKGMDLTPSQHVVFTMGYADPVRPCFYLPNRIKMVIQ